MMFEAIDSDDLPRLPESTLSDSETGHHSVKEANRSAEEHDAVAIRCSRENHFDTRTDSLADGDIDLVHATAHPGIAHEVRQTADAVISGISRQTGDGIAHDDGHSEPLVPEANLHDGQLNVADCRHQHAGDIHDHSIHWPGSGEMTQSVDWSPFGNRPTIVHHANDIGNHTPGPWFRSNRCVTSSRQVICEVWSHIYLEPSGELQASAAADANQALICAAPDLLAALEEALAVLEKLTPASHGQGTLVRARAAIAKAKEFHS